ncbi:MAG: acyl-CoA thioesterase [Ferruginibacter sp.]
MEEYVKTLEIRWADLDPNFHVLHSRYYDFGAYCRMCFLVEHGIDPALMQSLNIGAVLFREECIFRKELKFGDELSVNLRLQKASHDFSRWSMVHELFKNKITLAAIIHIDAAWIDTKLRKLSMPPKEVESVFNAAPKTADFIFYSR